MTEQTMTAIDVQASRIQQQLRRIIGDEAEVKISVLVDDGVIRVMVGTESGRAREAEIPNPNLTLKSLRHTASDAGLEEAWEAL
jgi:hypothetical protein